MKGDLVIQNNIYIDYTSAVSSNIIDLWNSVSVVHVWAKNWTEYLRNAELY